MTDFFGKTYRYNGTVIGVCRTLDPDKYMAGTRTVGGHKRMKSLPTSESMEEVQAALDAWAQKKGLLEEISHA